MNGPVQVATDGACLGNPGPGGWAWTIGLTDASGGQYVTTNQEMELRAILEALRAHPDQAIVILTDSQYAIDCVTTWLPEWQRRGWRTSARRPVKHQPIIKAIAAEQDRRTVQLVKVPGHAGHPLNERADRLAAAAAAQAALTVQQLEAGPLHRFGDWPNDQVPKRAAGVYSVWDGDRIMYVGMSGRAMTAEDLEVSPTGRVVAKGLWTRLNAHASGRRSGDQFCVDVCDRFVVPALTPSQQHQLAAGGLSLDDLTRGFIRDQLAYRFVVTADGTEAARLEVEVRRGALSIGRPYLNPLEPPWS